MKTIKLVSLNCCFPEFSLEEDEFSFIKLCAPGLIKFFGAVPDKIFISTEKPKKKGWRKIKHNPLKQYYLIVNKESVYTAFEPHELKSFLSLIGGATVFWVKGEI